MVFDWIWIVEEVDADSQRVKTKYNFPFFYFIDMINIFRGHSFDKFWDIKTVADKNDCRNNKKKVVWNRCF